VRPLTPTRSSSASRGRRWSAAASTSLAAVLFLASPAAAQQKPDPKSVKDPESYCASLTEEKRRETDICKTQAERDEDAQKKRWQEAEDRERNKHSSFLRKFHLDGAWIPTQVGGVGQYGVIGTHLDVASVGRVHLFGPPGMMLLLEKNAEGSWKIRPALTYGVSVYLTEVPWGSSHAQLYFNLAKTWSTGSFQSGQDLAGLSLSWKK
jgi:hypothetical protein